VVASAAGSRARIERICSSDDDARTLRLRLLDEVGRIVGFDHHVWVLTDPETAVGASPLAAVPDLSAVPRLVRLRYVTALARWTTLTEDPVASLAGVTGGDLDASPLWRELLSGYGVRDVASVVFRDGFGCWAFLELWRTTRPPFDAAELAVLRALTAPVTEALRRAQARTFAAGLSRTRHLEGPVVLLLSPDLEVRRQTPGTHEQLRRLVPRDDSGPPVPAGAYNVAAQLLALEAGVDAHPPWARAHLGDGVWCTMRAARLDGPEPVAVRDIAVTIEEATVAERLSIFALAYGLSPRERELLGRVADGLDTTEVAARMHLSAHTVQDHLKSVFTKTGTHSRRMLLARARGT
jgi:DNA-binding CsgD family transcriptional regulator